ncbi:MAG: glycoside hydrolase family 32 protein [Oscillospiraceae bacterium]|nr:glycoside hydrolase family 32 protein [Oscillospiraceae bacterium]
MSELLKQARRYAEANMPAADDERLPCYHVTGGVGWINDPNGFSVYKGEYHLFYQYHPYAKYWGPMHWGHVKSKDLIHWERLPVALAPDQPYDTFGVFSGSAVETPDGRHLLMYTGVHTGREVDGTRYEIQKQCIAIGDGVNYEKVSENPVIDDPLIPPGGSHRDFRDPKIWWEDGHYKAVVANRYPDGAGAVLLYESDDAVHWRFSGTPAVSGGRYGQMWECPDLFRLDGETVLIVSAFELIETGLELLPGNGVLALIGDYDKENVKLTEKHVHAADYGLDFYAPTTMLTPDGRRVMIGWMQYWDSTKYPPKDLPFFGQLTVPRELRVSGGRLYQTPVRELEACRGEAVRFENIPINGELTLPGVSGRCLDMTVTLHTGNDLQSFTMLLAADDEHQTSVTFKAHDKTLTVDRTKSGYRAPVRQTRTLAIWPHGNELKIRVLLDRWSMELFLNDGEKAATFTLYTPQEARGISFNAEGSARMDVEKYDLVF